MPKTLLVADDSVVIQKLVGLSFANEEVDLISTDNGDDAIAMVHEKKPDLVLADVVMPGKSGYEVCQAIKQAADLRHIPVLLLTGTFEAFDEGKAGEVGADGHITKPFEAQILVDRVNDLLARAPEAPAIETPTPSAEGDYDFFEVNTGNLAESGAGGDSPVADKLHLGDPFAAAPIAGLDSPASSPAAEHISANDGFAGDRTVAVMPEDTIDGETKDAIPSPPPLPGRGDPSADQGLTALADFDFDSGDPAPAAHTPLGDTVLAEDFSFESTSGDSIGGAPILGDDLFGESDAIGAPTASNSFDFGTAEFSSPEPEATSGSATSPASPPSLTEPYSPTPPLQAQPSAPTPEIHANIAADAMAELPEALEAQPLAEAGPELQVELEPDVAPLMQTATDPSASATTDPGFASPTVASPASSQSDAGLAPDLAPMIRERLHETLEKVAWEAFADISDSIVRQVIEKVETIAWEVIPQMAETMIQEEIRRMKGESE